MPAKPHDWTEVPYDKAVELGIHKNRRPYTWVCRGCGSYAHQSRESFHPYSDNGGVTTSSMTWILDCDLELVTKTLKE